MGAGFSSRWWSEFLATGFYTGYSKRAPGTVGTVGALILAASLSHLMPQYFVGANGWFIAICLIALAIVVSEVCLRTDLFGADAKDPQKITIDEYAGFFVAIAGHETTWTVLVGGFILFRLFDISKFFPGKLVERLPGGWGIVLDDVVAGVYANIILFLFLRFNA